MEFAVGIAVTGVVFPPVVNHRASDCRGWTGQQGRQVLFYPTAFVRSSTCARWQRSSNRSSAADLLWLNDKIAQK